jgi:ubiquinone/menaquinone biosynthesis C-methylase UbiE
MDKTKIAVAVFDKHAKMYQEKFMDVSVYQESLDFFLRHLKHNNASILEIACGPGNVTKNLLDKNPALKILATDLSPNMLALAKGNNPSADFKLMDGRSVALLKEKFAGVVCGFFLPYLSKEETLWFIKDVASVLEEGGLMYLSTMEDKYNKSGIEKGSKGDEIFIHYHEFEYLSEMLKINQFKILNVWRHHSLLTNGKKVTDLVIVAEKGQTSEAVLTVNK